MKLTGELKEKVEKTETMEEAKKVIEEAGMELTDDELNEIFTRLRVRVGAKGKIIVIADACHSGSGSRGQLDEEVYVAHSIGGFIIKNLTTGEERLARIDKSMVDKEYKLRGSEMASQIIDSMDTAQLREYLKRRIDEDAEFGIQILKGEEGK